MDALADCGRARALDPSFHKVLSRLASLHEAVRRPGAALSFLQALQACPGGTAAGGGQAAMRQRIADLRVSETRGGTPHHFKLLHLPLTATVRPPPTPLSSVCSFLFPYISGGAPLGGQHASASCCGVMQRLQSGPLHSAALHCAVAILWLRRCRRSHAVTDNVAPVLLSAAPVTRSYARIPTVAQSSLPASPQFESFVREQAPAGARAGRQSSEAVALCAQAADVRSAYRKLALGNHPDKARTGCAYAPSLSGPPLAVRDTGLHDRVVAAADDLFKVINEACTVLSDNVKRDKCARELGGGGGPAARYGAASSSLAPCDGMSPVLEYSSAGFVLWRPHDGMFL